MPMATTPTSLRILRCIEPDQNGCWIWHGNVNREGYGRIHVGLGVKLAHRQSYEEFAGAIPEGLTLDHLCRVPLCVNPDHLEPVTLRVNIGRVPLRTHCRHGHPYNDANTYVRAGKRHCRACALDRHYQNRDARLAYNRARRAALKAAL